MKIDDVFDSLLAENKSIACSSKAPPVCPKKEFCRKTTRGIRGTRWNFPKNPNGWITTIGCYQSVWGERVYLKFWIICWQNSCVILGVCSPIPKYGIRTTWIIILGMSTQYQHAVSITTLCIPGSVVNKCGRSSLDQHNTTLPRLRLFFNKAKEYKWRSKRESYVPVTYVQYDHT